MDTTQTICDYCKTQFILPLSKHDRAVKLNRKLYCSRKCYENRRSEGYNRVTIPCINCNKEININKGAYDSRNKRKKSTKWFCCDACCREYKTNNGLYIKVDCVCNFCNQPFKILKYHTKKSQKHFCTRKCQGFYASQENMLGNNRSKLEVLLEAHIKMNIPDIVLETNNRSVCSPVELDFYFPVLNKAIEINGPAHYKPVFGESCLQATKRNDSYKRTVCDQKNIELLIIDSTLNPKQDNSKEIFEAQIKPFLV